MGRLGRNVTPNMAFLRFSVVLQLKNIRCSHHIIPLSHKLQIPVGCSNILLYPIYVLFIIFDELVTSVIKSLGLSLIFRYIETFRKFTICHTH